MRTLQFHLTKSSKIAFSRCSKLTKVGIHVEHRVFENYIFENSSIESFTITPQYNFIQNEKKKKSKIFEKCSFRKEIIVFEIGSSIEEFLLHRPEDFQA